MTFPIGTSAIRAGTILLTSHILSSTVIPAGGFLVLSGAELGFRFNARLGGTVRLIQVDSGGRPVQFVDEVSFEPTFSRVSVGRVPAYGTFSVLNFSTFGAANSSQRFPDVIISEEHYSPLDPDGPRGIRPDNLEFVEIYNRSDAAVELGSWQLTGGVSFAFPEGEMLRPGEAVPVVGFETDSASRTDAFRTVNSLELESRLFGSYDGSLRDTAGQIKLLQRDPASPNSAPVWVVVDEVSYDSESPWPANANGQGDSLHRIHPAESAIHSGNWRAATPSPNSDDFAARAVGDANSIPYFRPMDSIFSKSGG